MHSGRSRSGIFGAGMNVPILPRKTLHNELVVLLRNMIVEGDLGPGNRIPEVRLCDLFGVSRTPLREALKVLSAEGLVCLLPNKGARVVEYTRQELEEAIPILAALSSLAGELACANIADGEIARIRAMTELLVEHYHAGDQQCYSETNRAIHEAIFEAAGNKMLTDTYSTLQVRLRSITYVTPKTPPRWDEAVTDHQEMVVALENRDGVRLAAVARHHLRHRADMVRAAVDALEARKESKNRPLRRQPA